MVRQSLIKLVILMAVAGLSSQGAYGQIELRRGVLPLNQLREFALRGSSTLSYGSLAQLRDDPNFTGNIQLVIDAATNILEGYTVVRRGGYFPENQGIPREQQLTTADAVYYVLSMDNGNQLVLYRSPLENTSQYLIRTPSTTF